MFDMLIPTIMKADSIKIKTIRQYMENFPESTQKILRKLHKAIKETAPDAEETISYNMPAFMLNGPLVYYAGYKHHIGFYPTGAGIAAFKDVISDYKHSKGAIQFPIDEPLPLDLVKKIVKHRVKMNLEKKEKRTN